MLDWTNPGALGTLKEWTKYVSKPLAIGQSKNSKDVERIRAKVGLIFSRIRLICVNQLCRKLPQPLKINCSPNISSAGTFGFQLCMPQLTLPNKDEGYYQNSGNCQSLRRLGDGYLPLSQLPHKFDRVVFCPLTETQTAVYERLLQTPNVQNILRRKEECDCGSKKPYVWSPKYADRETLRIFLPSRHKCHHKTDLTDIFRYMATFIKISNHLALILPGTHRVTRLIRMLLTFP